MKIRSALILGSISLCASLCYGQGQAENNLLKPFSNLGSSVHCFNHVHRCIVPVYVHASGDKECTAWIDPANVYVPQPNKAYTPRIKVIWLLRAGDTNTKIKQFAFDPNKGIDYDDTSGMQDRTQFDSDGLDDSDPENLNPDDPATSDRRFRWASKHPAGTYADVHYRPTVIRTTGFFGSTTRTCQSNDPTISNTN